MKTCQRHQRHQQRKWRKEKEKEREREKNAVARKEATTTPRRIRLLHADECRKRAKSRKAIKTGRMRERERKEDKQLLHILYQPPLLITPSPPSTSKKNQPILIFKLSDNGVEPGREDWEEEEEEEEAGGWVGGSCDHLVSEGC